MIRSLPGLGWIQQNYLKNKVYPPNSNNIHQLYNNNLTENFIFLEYDAAASVGNQFPTFQKKTLFSYSRADRYKKKKRHYIPSKWQKPIK
jgi:hypothetical protein